METEQQDGQMIKYFSELINKYEFFIPGYQRAYSWTEKEIALFITDITEHAGKAEKKTQYYLGHYILEDDKKGKMAIVDGQQRLSTVAIFLAVCQYLRNSSAPPLRLRLTVVDYDEVRFKELLLPNNLNALENQTMGQKEAMEATASLRRVVQVIQHFLKSFQPDTNQQKTALLFVEKIDDYLDVIRKAAVSVGIYDGKAVASQIFELHNTRGVLLTETEKVKALLMKYVYLNSTDGNRDVDDIQKCFAKIFQMEEKAANASFRGEMNLDDILTHHLRAVDDGEDKNSFVRPQSVEGENGCVAYVRNKLKEFGDYEEGIEYAKALASEFARSMSLISENFVDQDRNEPLIGDVILLDQRRSMIFLLRYFRATGQAPHRVLLKRWESFLFLWDCHDVFYNMKSGKKDSFSDIFQLITKEYEQVSGLLGRYYSGETAFAYRDFQIHDKNENGEEIAIKGLDKIFLAYMTKLKEQLLHSAYNWGHWHARYKYWLYKFEIEDAINKDSSDQANRVRCSLRDLFKQNDVTLDHIIPHELEWKELSVKGGQDNNIDHWKDAEDRNQAEANWKEISKSIDGIGNLVLLSRSINASLQNIAPFKRATVYKSCGLESVSYKEVGNWNNPIDWQANIEARGEYLLKWMKEYFTDKATWTDKVTK